MKVLDVWSCLTMIAFHNLFINLQQGDANSIKREFKCDA